MSHRRVQQKQKDHRDEAAWIRWKDRLDSLLTRRMGAGMNALAGYDYQDMFDRGWSINDVAEFIQEQEETT